MPSLLQILINSFPMLLLIAVWIFFMWRSGLGRRGYTTQYRKDYIEQMHRQTEILQRIAIALEKIASP
jgi:hypothetical protein